MEVVFSNQSFKDMVLFSGRFANLSIPEEQWKEVYGFLVGQIKKKDSNDILYVKKLIPMVHGSRTEVYFGEQDYILSEPLMEKINLANMFVCGWYHTHPGLSLFLSDTDIYNQLGFQSVFPNAIAAVFDFTKVTSKNNGLKVFRLDEVEMGVASTFSEVPYEIEAEKSNDEIFMARSLIDIAGAYGSNQPLIKEAGEIFKETGSFDSMLADLADSSSKDTNPNNIKVQELSHEEEFVDFKTQISDMESAMQLKTEDYEDNLQWDEESSQYLDDEQYGDDSYYQMLDNFSENDFQTRALMEKIEYATENNQPTGYLMIRIARRFSEISKNNEALQYLQSAEAEFIARNDKIGEATAKNEIGLFYEDRGDYTNALNYLDSAVEILTSISQDHQKVHVLNNIGNVYVKMNEHASAFS